jgi:AcrR family transcriptional regulator
MLKTTDEPSARGLARRADARRNSERLLIAARAAFAENGTGASLRDVARRAGVGIGTLYRHFPTREALLEALLRQSFDRLRSDAEDLLASPSPGDALITWLRELATRSTTYQGLPASVMAAMRDQGSELHSSCQAMRHAATQLLVRAQQSGDVRSDVTPTELLALAAGVAWVGEQASGQAGLTDRLLSLTMKGLQLSQQPEQPVSISATR